MAGFQGVEAWAKGNGGWGFCLTKWVSFSSTLALTRVAVEFETASTRHKGATGIFCSATVETVGPTGVEMEALTAVQVALLTIYDMCKAVDRGMSIHDVRVVEKHGGKSGSYVVA